MKCNSFLCLGVFVVGMVAFGANVNAGPRGGDRVAPVSSEVAKRTRLRNGMDIHDIRDDPGEMNRIRVGTELGSVASGSPTTPVWDAPTAGFIFGPWNPQDSCAGAVDMLTAPTGWGDQWNFGNGADAGGTGGAELVSYRVDWCVGYSEWFDGPGVCNTIAGDDTSCTDFGSLGYCVDCYDGTVPYTVTVGVYTTADPCAVGFAGTLIPGTEVSFASTGYRLGGQSCTEAIVGLPAKTYVPDGSYFELMAGVEDLWFPLGLAATVGTPGDHLDWWIDADSDGCYDTYSCFSGTVWSSIGVPWVASGADAAAAYTLSLLPIALDEYPANGGDASGVNGNTITMVKGGHRLVLELWWSDWATGPKGNIPIVAMQANLDSSGFTSGLRGTITYPEIACSSDANCWGGGRCGFSGASPPQWIDKCEPGYMDQSRSDYIFVDPPNSVVGGNDFSTMNLRFGATLTSPAITSPGVPTYAATILTEISANAAGTFTIWPQVDPAVGLLGAAGTAWQGKNLPLLGLIPAVVTIQTGACCDLTPGAFSCMLTPEGSEQWTANECAAAGGVWTPGADCNSGACHCCLTDSQCADGDACTIDTCEPDCTCLNTPVVLDPGDCCDDLTTLGSAADVTGAGSITNNIDGDQCTQDICDAGPGRGTAGNPPEPQGVPCDDGICDTFDDMCDGAGTCDGTFVQTAACCDSPGVNCDDANCPELAAGCAPPMCDCTSGFCHAHPLACCHPDLTCSIVFCADDCTAGGGVLVPECLGGPGPSDLACEGCIPRGDDCWATGAGRTKFDFCAEPIPAGFFGPGSEPFDGPLALKGTGQSAADTTVRRLDSLCLPDVDSPGTIEIELVALSLESVEPITVTFEGQDPQEWNVDVELSTTSTPQGSMTITKTHENGGTFRSGFYVLPRFTFTNKSDPSRIHFLDMGDEGMAPLQLETRSDEPWVHQVLASYVATPCGVNFAPGIVEDPETGEQCCKKVGHSAGPGHAPGHIHETGPPNCLVCPSGACCMGKGGCQLAEPAGPATAEVVCDGWGGEYMGDGTDCTDSDGDGLADVTETDANCCFWDQADACHNGTDSRKFDTDGDGCSDGDEVMNLQTDPCDPAEPSEPCPDSPDCNANGIPDAIDLLNGLDCDGDGEINCPPPGEVDCKGHCTGTTNPCVDVDDCTGAETCDGIREDCKGVCCHALTACVEATREWCETRVPDNRGSWSFRGLCTKCPTTGGDTADHQGLIIRHFTEGGPALDVCVNSGAVAAVACIEGDLIDAWRTNPDEDMCHQFGVDPCPASCPDDCSPPIPADFFGPGSEPFDGEVCLEGVPIGGEFGDADTLIRRSAEPFDRCDLPSTLEVTVDAELIQLSLRSKAPIIVAFNGETDCQANPQNCQQWDVVVALSDWLIPPMGEVSAVKTHCNGGTYSSVLNVQPKFTFSRVGGGGEAVLDTGCLDPPLCTESICHVTLIQGQGPEPDSWLSDLDPGVEPLSPYCTDFHPAFSTDNLECQAGTLPPSCDCNCNVGNGSTVRDRCEIESGLAYDCNDNVIPDECELSGNDCNTSGIPDDCELVDNDCNGNGVPDDCDIDPTDPDGNGLVSQDCTNDNTPDECEQDCDGDGDADSCEIAACAGTPDCADCNSNGVPDGCEPDCNGNNVADSCDIRDGVLHDNDGDGLPDECDCGVASAAVSAAPRDDAGDGINVRYLSISAGDAGLTQAIRVQIPGVGTMWVGPPVEVTENAGKTDPNDPQVAGFPTCWVSTLTCDPQYVNWGDYSAVHVYHGVLAPAGSYLIDVIDEGCALTLAGNFSPVLEFNTSAWGDVVGDCGSVPCTAPDGSVDVTSDVTAVLNKFKNLTGAPIKARADLEPAVPDQKINISDVTMALEGFKGFSYPFPPVPWDCP